MSTQVRHKFTPHELAGSFGDFGLFIPLVVAMTITAELNIGIILIFAGLMNILTGVLFRQPIPVQPMKALAVVVIAENMLKEELFAAGIMMGIILILISFFIDKVEKVVPKVLVRGIQLGVGCKLILKSFEWLQALPVFGWNSWVMSAGVLTGLVFLLRKKQPALLYIFLAGFLIIYQLNPQLYSAFAWSLPEWTWHLPDVWAFKYGFFEGVVPQLPLTVLNSVIAVCALSRDYFPGKGISAQKMSRSVGIMNVICVPFGAIPMCHGSSGLAAHYRFGARTGGSVIMLGILKVAVGLLFGNFLFSLLQAYPEAILAPMLIFAGYELSVQARDMFSDKSTLIILWVTALGIVLTDTFMGFLSGIIFYAVITVFQKGRHDR